MAFTASAEERFCSECSPTVDSVGGRDTETDSFVVHELGLEPTCAGPSGFVRLELGRSCMTISSSEAAETDVVVRARLLEVRR